MASPTSALNPCSSIMYRLHDDRMHSLPLLLLSTLCPLPSLSPLTRLRVGGSRARDEHGSGRRSYDGGGGGGGDGGGMVVRVVPRPGGAGYNSGGTTIPSHVPPLSPDNLHSLSPLFPLLLPAG